MTSGLPRVLEMLRCPHCGQDLAMDAGAVACGSGHAFDVARQGYVNLLPGNHRVGTADSPDMVASREAFLSAGHYAPIAAAVTAAARAAVAEVGTVLDFGAGTGHYLAGVLASQPAACGVALDASKHAARRAARAHSRIGAVVCDVWRPLPVKDAVADVVLDVFAPRNGPEMRRVLRPGGAAVVVTPRPEHLAEIVSALSLLRVAEDKQDRVAATLADFRLTETTAVTTTLKLDAEGLGALVRMGPSAWHTNAATLTQHIADMPLPAEVTAAVDVGVYRPS